MNTRITVVLAAVMLITAQTAYAQSLFIISEGAVVAAHAADTLSSVPCLNGTRCRETNTLYADKHPAVLIGTKAAVATAHVLLTRRIARAGHRKIASAVNVAVSSLLFTVAYRNMRNML